MSKKIVLLLVALVSVVALLVPATSSAKATCIEKTVGKVHIQVGYCP